MERADPLDGLIALDDLEARAVQVMERPAYDFFAGGAGNEWTLAENRRAFDRWVLRPRYLVDVSKVRLDTAILGQPMPFPVVVAPTAVHRLAHPEGEVATARGAAAAGATMCVSTSATMPFREIAATGVSWWFQVYVHRSRAITERMVANAVEAGCSALVLTVDLPYLGARERDLRNRMDQWFPPDVQITNVLQAAGEAHPGSELFDEQLWYDPALTWDDLSWLRGLSSLPLLVKGVMTAEDAALAVDHGAEGVVVSNHGGRQLDGVSGTLDALPEVVDAVRGGAEVLIDGGIRRGADVVKAVALGARGVMIGRPCLWGLAIAGDHGVRWALETLRKELELAMALTGAPSVDAIVPAMVAPAPGSR